MFCVKTKRVKEKERSYARKDRFWLSVYRFECDGKRYLTFAHNIPDAEMMAGKIDTYQRDCETHFSERKRITCVMDKDYKKDLKVPFWYYGRIYEIIS